MQGSVGKQNIPQQCQCPPQYLSGQSIAQPIQQAQQPVQQPVQQNGTINYQTNPAGPVQQVPMPQQVPQQAGQNVQVPNYSGVNIQIFNPSVTPPGANAPVYNVNAPNYAPNGGCYPSNYYTDDFSKRGAKKDETTDTNQNVKKEKREIVQLTDEYIRNLENYLNSQDKEVRLMGAKEVIARLDEDHSRKDDKALNALVNKMLQDPYAPIRALALGSLDSRIATGDQFTVNLLQQMQNSQSGYGQDAMQAANVLLKMSGQTVEKEFEVKESNKTTKKSSRTEETKVGK